MSKQSGKIDCNHHGNTFQRTIPLLIYFVEHSSRSGKQEFQKFSDDFYFFKLYKHFLLKINLMNFENKLILRMNQIFVNEKN